MLTKSTNSVYFPLHSGGFAFNAAETSRCKMLRVIHYVLLKKANTNLNRREIKMHMQQENREKLGMIFGFTAIFAVCGVFGFVLYKYWNLLNINIVLSVFGGMFIVTGSILSLVQPKSRLPHLFIFIGAGEQAIMLMVYLDFKLYAGTLTILGLAAIVSFCIFGIKRLKLDLSDEEIAELEPEPQLFASYSYTDTRYNVQKGKAENGSAVEAKVIDIETARKPPLAG